MKKKRIDPVEAMRALQSDPDWLARIEARDRALLQATEARLKAEEPILRDLADAGVRVSSVWDLVNTSVPYPDALPVLVRHLGYEYPDEALEGIARALAVKAAEPFWDVIYKTFLQTSPLKNPKLKEALALALAAASGPAQVRILAAIVADKVHGEEGRLPLLRALAQSNDYPSHLVLLDAVDDPQLTLEAADLVKRYRKRIEKASRGRVH